MGKNLKDKIEKNQRIFQSNFLIKNRKAELTTQQIVLLIILLVSFVIILFLLFRLNFKGESEKELCYNSVMMRGSAAVPAEATPLKCSTTYVCITKDGSCEGLTKPEVKKVKTKEEIYQVLADEMAECWWMFGEGKVNYVGKDFKHNLYCSICSQILFDNSLEEVEEVEEVIDKRDFYGYLEKTKISEEQTYLEYLTSVRTVEEIEDSIAKEGGNFGSFELGDKQYFVMMGIYSEVGVWKWVLGLGALGGGIVAGIIAAPFTVGVSAIASASLISAASVGGGVGGYYLGVAVKGDSGYDFLAPTILEANSEEFNAFKCKDIKTLI